ncbi:Hypothetical protein CAP_0466 [Chondromyces apiculatus DSM 436]|uniref:Uncharacterized protein n=1 Tax=Chondromyces apiculatus DSM 436 TaxID=1192034 RepID=A0A017SVI7_9BACT|nr:Hypothetical protein CAP_0466 [Chondromyces apiculatus DSM 436]
MMREMRNTYAAGGWRESRRPEERLRTLVVARIAQLTPMLCDWQQRYPVLLAARIVPVIKAIVVPLPGGTTAQHLALCKLGLVAFALDDVVDGELGDLSDGETYEICARYAEIARGTMGVGWAREDTAAGMLARAIAEVREEMRACPGAARYLGAWEDAFWALCLANRAELVHKRQAGMDGSLPSLKAYLRAGWVTSGAPMYFAAVLVVTGAGYAEHPLEDAVVRRAMLHMGLSIRWFNDARTVDREREEGKLNNGVNLLVAAGMEEGEAERKAMERGDWNLRKLEALVEGMGGELQGFGAGMVALVHLIRGVYLEQGEFHAEERREGGVLEGVAGMGGG